MRIKLRTKYLKLYGGFLLSVFILLAFCMPIYAQDSRSKSFEIKGIEILDHAVSIKVDGPVVYKIHKLEDPFRIAVDIEGVTLGKFTAKIFPDKGGITEIAPVQIQTPATASRFNILMQSPATVVPEVRDGLLILNLKEDSRAAGTAALPGGKDKSQAEDAEAEEITEVILNKTTDGIELVIKGDGAMPDPAVLEVDKKIMIDIPGVVMKASLPSSLVPPIKDIRYRIESDKTRFILDMEDVARAEVVALDDELVVDIAYKAIAGKKADAAEKADDLKKTKAVNNMVSFDVQEADIVSIMRLLSDVSGYNVVVHPDVKGKITMKLINVPWEQALDIILKTFNLEKVMEGNVIRIASIKAFQDERKAIADTKEIYGKAEDIDTKVFVVNYANVDKVKDSIDKAKVLTPRGNISTDVRTRSIIVKDIPSSLNEIQKLIDTLDKPTPQVLIDARIVEVSSNFSRELGVEWGGHWNAGLRTETQIPMKGSVSTSSVLGGNASNPVFVNLPTAGAPTGAMTIGYLNSAQTFGLDLRISALESSGKGRVVSNPKIMTVDNEKAVIKQGRRIPYSTVSQSGTQVQFVDASLDLIVTPQVGPDKTILLIIQANKNEADFSQTSQGLPSIRTSEASTQVLVKDGETVVIGGILKTNESDSEAGVPGISKIPILGWLFKRNAKTATSEEQLIFITPRIVSQ